MTSLKAAHVPVLLQEALAALAPRDGGLYIDGTFGRGGYARAILERARGAKVIGLDRDPAAIEAAAAHAAEFPGRFTAVEACFAGMEAAAGISPGPVDGVVLDIGVSSPQIDDAARGFSFMRDGPLDMRMGGAGRSAADIINTAGEAELADIFYFYGEERQSRRAARAIVEARRAAAIASTRALADIASRAIAHKPGGIHPATRIFQALRIAVNDELMQLAQGLAAAERLLKPGGRLAVVTFHSLEDRIVKQFFNERSGRGSGGSRHRPAAQAQAAGFVIEGKQPVAPSEAEIAANPRARSAKLRAGIRTEAPAQGLSEALNALASLPQTERRRR